MKATSDAVYDYDLVNNTIEWNNNLQLWGYEPCDVSPGIDWWAERLHPDDKEATLTALDQAIRSDPGMFQATYRFRCGDGRYRNVVDKGFVLKNSAGKAVRLVGAMHDVHIYRQMFERNPQPMWAFHLDTLQFLAVNEMAIRLYGYSREEFLSMKITQIRPPEDIPLLQAVLSASDREHEGRTIWRHYTKSGQLLHVEVRTQDLEIDGAPARMSLITDVSRRIAVEKQLRESQKLEAVGQLARGIAHDFNNLLTIIQGYSSTSLANLAPDHPLRPSLLAIDAAANSAVNLTHQLLTFARQKSNAPKVHVWADIIANAELLLRKLLPDRISIEFITRTGPATIRIDASQLEQILLNLVTNARDAIPAAGAIRVTSAIVQLNESHPDHIPSLTPGPYFQLTISDTGIGMSDTVLSHIFEPFFTTKPEGQGTGLGLSTVYAIVLQTGGIIRVDSMPGEGSEFRVYLPCNEATPSTRTILLVEDDSDLSLLLKSALEQAGFTVIPTANGNQALAILKAQTPDLMLTDIVMPDREGLELVQLVRKSHPALPIAVMSGAFEGKFLSLATSFGANLVFRKPLDIKDLILQIRSLLDTL